MISPIGLIRDVPAQVFVEKISKKKDLPGHGPLLHLLASVGSPLQPSSSALRPRLLWPEVEECLLLQEEEKVAGRKC